MACYFPQYSLNLKTASGVGGCRPDSEDPNKRASPDSHTEDLFACKLNPAGPGYEQLWAGGVSRAEEETNVWADPHNGPRRPGIDLDVPLRASKEENANWERQQREALERMSEAADMVGKEVCEIHPHGPKLAQTVLATLVAQRVWIAGPPDRPELGRYPETVRWVYFRQEISRVYKVESTCDWPVALAALPLTHLRWLLENQPLNFIPRIMSVFPQLPLATMMAAATELGHYRKARMLYEWKSSNQRCEWGEDQALFAALYFGMFGAARFFLERWNAARFDGDRKGDDIWAATYALSFACNFGERAPEFVDYLLKRGADARGLCVSRDLGNPPLWLLGHPEMPLAARLRCMGMLISAGASPNGERSPKTPSHESQSPLANHIDSPQALRLLLDARADPEAIATGSPSCLVLLSTKTTPHTARILLEHGALTLVEPEWMYAYVRYGRLRRYDKSLEEAVETEDPCAELTVWEPFSKSQSVMQDALDHTSEYWQGYDAVYTALLQEMPRFPAPMTRHCCRVANDAWLARIQTRNLKQMPSLSQNRTVNLQLGCARRATCKPEIMRLWLALGHPLSQECIKYLRRRYPSLRGSLTVVGKDDASDGIKTPRGAAKKPLRNHRKRAKLAPSNPLTAGLGQLTPEPAFLAVQRGTGLSSVMASLCLQAWVEDFETRI